VVRIDYVLPLRWADDAGLDELTAYLRELAALTDPVVDVVVADGSPAPVFAAHAAAWRGLVTHVPVDPDLAFANGKVSGVTTGVRRGGAEVVVLADDDVRWDADGLRRAAALLGGADLVRPQNHFDPLPWHARWDTGRTLLNRATGGDFPGTLVVRRSAWERTGGYDGDVLFENLELIRTVEAAGGRELRAPDLYVRRLPPEASRFWNQRVRQAYDELARPWRMAVFLGVVPALAAARRRPAAVALGAAGVVALAEAGRRRGGGARYFPVSSSLLAPVWLLERGVCSWLALAGLARGGVRYSGRRLRTAAHPRRRLAARVRPGRRLEAGRLVGAVAERLEG
jgi:hypothetical protein